MTLANVRHMTYDASGSIKPHEPPNMMSEYRRNLFVSLIYVQIEMCLSVHILLDCPQTLKVCGLRFT
jgi:hypothetical protein